MLKINSFPIRWRNKKALECLVIILHSRPFPNHVFSLFQVEDPIIERLDRPLSPSSHYSSQSCHHFEKQQDIYFKKNNDPCKRNILQFIKKRENDWPPSRLIDPAFSRSIKSWVHRENTNYYYQLSKTLMDALPGIWRGAPLEVGPISLSVNRLGNTCGGASWYIYRAQLSLSLLDIFRERVINAIRFHSVGIQDGEQNYNPA